MRKVICYNYIVRLLFLICDLIFCYLFYVMKKSIA